MIGQMQMLDTTRGRRPLEGARASTSRACSTSRDAPEGVAIFHSEDAGPRSRRRARPASSSRRPGRRSKAASPVKIDGDDPQHRPHRRRHALRRGRQALRPCRPARGHDRHVSLTGTAGQSFGAWVAARRHARPRRRGQRLCRQGPLRRPPRRAPAGRLRHRAGRVDHRRQHRALRRHRRRVLLPRRRRRALRRPQLRRHRRGRRRRRPLLRIHDRRRRRRARQAPAATSPPACRAASPMCSTRTARSRAAATWRWSSSSRSPRKRS